MHIDTCCVLCANLGKTEQEPYSQNLVRFLFPTADKAGAMISDNNKSFKTHFALCVQGKEWGKKSSDFAWIEARDGLLFSNLLIGSDSAHLSNPNFVKDKMTK